ncbi:succinylglutamate desuccinylase/aspartoacylase family protein, partial [uncultured Intestinimonas sp.]|uniref:succinylglutamate desuccinylase/aspartoacylase domain-containing protein n=1 Tax=uncultured Intestinimonas sp. TaxID=1689265 RepID=UPI0025D7ACA7
MKLTKLQELGNGRAKGVLPVSGGEGLPVWSLRGRQDGPTLVLTAGVHGCEYVGILALRRLFDSLETASLRGRVLLLPLVNGEGFFTGSKQVVPSDRKNLNRVFPPPPDGTRAERIAQAVVEQVYPQADFLLDLHGGDVNEAMTPLVFFPASA